MSIEEPIQDMQNQRKGCLRVISWPLRRIQRIINSIRGQIDSGGFVMDPYQRADYENALREQENAEKREME